MRDRHDIELARFEQAQDAAEIVNEQKLAIFREDPYSFCEWNIDAFSKYDMLAIVLEYLLPDFDQMAADNYSKASQLARKDLLVAIQDSAEKVEI
jgi:hypothetical protein